MLSFNALLKCVLFTLIVFRWHVDNEILRIRIIISYYVGWIAYNWDHRKVLSCLFLSVDLIVLHILLVFDSLISVRLLLLVALPVRPSKSDWCILIEPIAGRLSGLSAQGASRAEALGRDAAVIFLYWLSLLLSLCFRLWPFLFVGKLQISFHPFQNLLFWVVIIFWLHFFCMHFIRLFYFITVF